MTHLCFSCPPLLSGTTSGHVRPRRCHHWCGYDRQRICSQAMGGSRRCLGKYIPTCFHLNRLRFKFLNGHSELIEILFSEEVFITQEEILFNQWQCNTCSILSTIFLIKHQLYLLNDVSCGHCRVTNDLQYEKRIIMNIVLKWLQCQREKLTLNVISHVIGYWNLSSSSTLCKHILSKLFRGK